MVASPRVLFRRGRYAVARARSHSHKNLLPRRTEAAACRTEAGTIVFTLANSALAVAAITQLALQYPDCSFLFLVRRLAKGDDPSSHYLRRLEEEEPDRFRLRVCDFSKGLERVTILANELKEDIQNGDAAPLAAIVCSVQYVTYTAHSIQLPENHDPSFTIIYLAQFNFVLRLIDCFRTKDARIVVLNDRLYWRAPRPVLENSHRKRLPQSRAALLRHCLMRISKAYLTLTLAFEELQRRVKKAPGLQQIKVLDLDLSSFRCIHPARTSRIDTIRRSFLSSDRDPLVREVGAAARALVAVTASEHFNGMGGHYIGTARGLREVDTSPRSKSAELQGKMFHEAMRRCGISWNEIAERAEAKSKPFYLPRRASAPSILSSTYST
ncbi:hypothetical protein BDV96DRAFT_640481 [Lophiotrema nucula]|uniref:Uncharacterized protein n=1 Tax=Lophiotrema nucula TaxID=690887 RepID=A0A6A5ZS18_9PLEO|nr:hypothetical protein BDV96DRAFT_640481 [Lophiotrema nucula]